MHLSFSLTSGIWDMQLLARPSIHIILTDSTTLILSSNLLRVCRSNPGLLDQSPKASQQADMQTFPSPYTLPCFLPVLVSRASAYCAQITTLLVIRVNKETETPLKARFWRWSDNCSLNFWSTLEFLWKLIITSTAQNSVYFRKTHRQKMKSKIKWIDEKSHRSWKAQKDPLVSLVRSQKIGRYFLVITASNQIQGQTKTRTKSRQNPK